MSTIRLFLTAVVALVATIAPQAQTIRISTSQTDLFLKVNPQGRLYQVYFGEKLANVCLRGLDPTATYEVKEINLMPGAKTESRRYSGDYLVKIGLPLFSDAEGTSTVYEIFVI